MMHYIVSVLQSKFRHINVTRKEMPDEQIKTRGRGRGVEYSK